MPQTERERSSLSACCPLCHGKVIIHPASARNLPLNPRKTLMFGLVHTSTITASTRIFAITAGLPTIQARIVQPSVLGLPRKRRASLMARKVTYWVTTILLAALSFLAAYGYLSGSPQSVEGFSHVGYPQQLRIILGIAKPLGAITLLLPGLARLKEWAYAGFTE